MMDGGKVDNKVRTYSIHKPRYIYKYYNNNQYALEAIKDSQLYMKIPSEFNDVFDCSFSINDSNAHQIPYTESIINIVVFYTHCDYKEQVKKILEDNIDHSKKLIDMFSILKNNCLPQDIIDSLKEHLYSRLTNLQADNNKIVCFSEINDSILMWSHYGKNLEGVCLRFDTEKDQVLKNAIQKVNYTLNRINSRENKNFEIYFTKSLDWSYEQEWRIVIDKEERFFETSAIDAIIIGEKVKTEDFAKITLLAEEKGLKIFHAKADKDEFKINIVEDEFNNF